MGLSLSEIFNETSVPISAVTHGELMINNFIVEGKLGEGSFGTVMKAYNTVNGNTYAIKVLRRQSIKRSTVMDEITILEQLEPECNIYTLCFHGAFESTNFYFIITEYLQDFITLEDYINKRSSIDYDYNLIIIKELIIGLEVLHTKICHRDIKPANIMVNMAGNVKYIDFGLSCNIACRSNVGSPIYIAPEIFTSTSPSLTFEQCKKGDYWALGVTIYEIEMPSNFIIDEINTLTTTFKHTTQIDLLKLLLKQYILQGVPWPNHLSSPNIYTPYALTRLLHIDPVKRLLPVVSDYC